LEVKIAEGYYGLCNKCDKDVFADNGVAEWLPFPAPEERDYIGQETRDAAKAMGLPPLEGVWVCVHNECITPGAKTEGLGE